MDRRDNELQELVDQVTGSLKMLPQENLERQITISVGGDNPGSIHVGSVVNINPAPVRPPELHEMDDRTLLNMKKALISNLNESSRRCYFNIPCILLFGLISGAFIFVLLNIFLILHQKPTLLDLDEKKLIIYASWVCLVTLAGKHLEKIRKIESQIATENQSIIDTIDVILFRRGR
ncbi:MULTISPECIES: hypothetical protein [Lonsdalea]|uniref:Uncharacterized protein n=3 Tax=Lonsdalea TaxID=1082702 RepID=A0ACD1JA65_9GAMM|nr:MULTISPECIES: hypothetical protein [Lonsdalea]OSM95592.1 hypothetical protein AU508_10890 [Lonsdalea populi]OSM96672.1 hypothetical protein AU499_14105 [Lonsdalea populi]QPQ23390.1 hypothetical protein I6N93_12140 [Lonsdalea populi]RAT11412.1 hypothetical protein AU485_14500 [Lonsdalea quercina]RAT12847.1 hypothetical protein AU486_15470 [Lonsdalea quercina]